MEIVHRKSMISQLFTDTLFIRGAFAASLIASMNSLAEILSPFIGFIAAVIGLIVGILTIWKIAIEIKIKNRELRRRK